MSVDVSLFTAGEAAKVLGTSVLDIRKRFRPAGSFTKPGGPLVPLFSAQEIKGK